MLSRELKKQLKNNFLIDWLIETNSKLKREIKLKDYVLLKCKKCGARKKHTVGNIQHAITRNPKHCRCIKCLRKEKRAKNSPELLDKLEKQMTESAHFPWYLDRTKIKPQKNYTQKTPIPLLCKSCHTSKFHTPSNIITCFKNKKHITCRICKLRESWQLKVKQKTKGQFQLDIHKNEHGFKIFHKKCGNYYYLTQPNLIKKGHCPFCSDGVTTLGKVKDTAQFSEYIYLKSSGKLKFQRCDNKKKTLLVSCCIHRDEPSYEISWSSFIISKRSKGAFLCPSCRKQRLRKVSYEEYNKKIAGFGLRIDANFADIKIDSKEKIRHICTSQSHHPPFFASPYEVLYKNKRCIYCYNTTSYHKNYEFIKNYIEMDEDRFFTHSGKKFRLLSTKEEIQRQIRPGKNISSIKIHMNELTCSIHNDYTLTWGNFYHRNAGCAKCSKESMVSYAHAYYLALLEFFKFDYTPEYPLKMPNKTTYRIDFKLNTLPNYVEIDSSLHVDTANYFTKTYNKSYLVRDRQKDRMVAGNIERIKLYGSDHKVLPIKDQLEIIDTAFINRAIRNGISITAKDIEAAKSDPLFFRNVRIVLNIKRLNRFHEGHIEFSSRNHLDIINIRQNNETEFYCKINKESFKRDFYSVTKINFLCPICLKKIEFENQQHYYLSADKIAEIKDKIESIYKSEFEVPPDWGTRAYFYRTVVFPIFSNSLKKEVYISIYDLMRLSLKQIKVSLKKGRYDKYLTDRPKIAREKYLKIYEPVIVDPIKDIKRVRLNKTCRINFITYQKNAKNINQLMKKKEHSEHIFKLINDNENKLNHYVHESNQKARNTLQTYDRKIQKFFANNPSFRLYTPREKYVDSKQYLLIQDLNCSHFFYSSWNWITAKLRKGDSIQCQHQSCFHKYYLLRNPEPRKIAQENILRIFTDLFNGQYYPTNHEKKIFVRERIEIIHLPSGQKYNVSVDNFRRGKFRSPFKNLTRKELNKKFRGWKKTAKIILL
jgi:hypothetical protein